MRTSPKRGQSLVEFAFLLPFFLLIVVGGVIDFGWAFYNLTLVQQMANDCARHGTEGKAAEGLSGSEILSYANSKKPSHWAGNLTVTTDPAVTSGNTTRILRVTVRYELAPLTPIYQAIVKQFRDPSVIVLAAAAAYKIPDFVVTR